jgi:hypothetical protein
MVTPINSVRNSHGPRSGRFQTITATVGILARNEDWGYLQLPVSPWFAHGSPFNRGRGRWPASARTVAASSRTNSKITLLITKQ